jgi:hypothetical protein
LSYTRYIRAIWTQTGVTPEIFDKGFETFQRLVLPRRINKESAGSSGQIIFIFGEKGEKIIDF